MMEVMGKLNVHKGVGGFCVAVHVTPTRYAVSDLAALRASAHRIERTTRWTTHPQHVTVQLRERVLGRLDVSELLCTVGPIERVEDQVCECSGDGDRPERRRGVTIHGRVVELACLYGASHLDARTNGVGVGVGGGVR